MDWKFWTWGKRLSWLEASERFVATVISDHSTKIKDLENNIVFLMDAQKNILDFQEQEKKRIYKKMCKKRKH